MGPSKRRSRSRLLLAGVAALVLTGLALPSTGQAAPPAKAGGKGSGMYIVQLAEMPVASYRGDVKGYKATHPTNGKKIDPMSSDVVAYAGFLTTRHNAVLERAGGGRKVYDYVYSFNGFAAELTEATAAKLSTMPGVVAVSADQKGTLDTATTPDFLGLTGSNGFYATYKAKGEGVVIGMVDSGIWPESLSFSDRTGVNGNATKDGKLDYQQLPGWHGKCVPGEEFNASMCNQKLIGAQYFNAGFGGNAGIDAGFPYEYNSPRDFDGHGTHTASTAGGNANVPTSGPAAVFGTVNGIAPRARIAAYKVCWGDGVEGGCFSSDSVAAIDQAVADGVDVINFSISGTSTSFLDPVEVAFLFAADAGVFVAASAGNSGPTASTVAHPSPWITTVAAGTHPRSGNGSVTLGNGVTYTGASVATAVGPAPLVDSVDAVAVGADPAEADLCVPGSLDPAKVAGAIVICHRGVIGRTEKSLAVQQAGGVGMVMYNSPDSSLNADFHFVPSVHVDQASGLAIKAYAATPGATASIAAAVIVNNQPAPLTATFSSRGPLIAAGGDLLKPDVIAPGQDILAAVAPPNNNGRDFDLLSGTSMSSPHVAGLGALFKELHPDWSPMAIKSALMTSATDVLDGPNTNPLVIFRQGAGHVAPTAAGSPGVVFDSGWTDWLGFLCGTGQLTASYCPSIKIDPSNFNTASIAIGDMPGSQTVTRTMTNVSGKPLTLSAATSPVTGMDVVVTPSSLTLQPGQSKSFTVKFTRTSATLNSYVGAQLTWTGTGARVRLPMVVRPVALAAPSAVSSTGAAISYPVTFGYTGSFAATVRGLVPSTVTAGVVADDPTDGACSLAAPNAQKIDVNVPAGTTLARFSLFDADVNPGSDLDMCVFRGTTQVGASGSGTSNEQVDVASPVAGTYTVVVQGWGVVGSTPFKLHSWLLGSTSAGNVTVAAPSSATTGATGTVTLSFSGLTAGQKYLGVVDYTGSSGLPTTVVRVDR